MPAARTCRFARVPRRGQPPRGDTLMRAGRGTLRDNARVRSCKASRHGRHGYAKFNSPVESNIMRGERARARVSLRGIFERLHCHPVKLLSRFRVPN